MDTRITQIHKWWKLVLKNLEGCHLGFHRTSTHHRVTRRNIGTCAIFGGYYIGVATGEQRWDPASHTPQVAALAGIPGRALMHSRVRGVRRSG